MMITRKIRLDYETLIDIYSKGISGGDQDGKFAITRIGKEELKDPILIPHELHHLVEVQSRTRMAIELILKKL